jgi:hypothetical protein
MSRKRHRPEEIVAKLRQVEVLTAQGQSVAEAIRSIGVTEVSSGTSCSTARSSPRSRRPRSSSRAGVGTTTPFDRTRPLAPSRPPRRSCCGRLRFLGQLRRPPRPWRSGLSCTNSPLTKWARSDSVWGRERVGDWLWRWAGREIVRAT